MQGLSLVDVSFDKIRAHTMAVEYYNSLLDDGWSRPEWTRMSGRTRTPTS